MTISAPVSPSSRTVSAQAFDALLARVSRVAGLTFPAERRPDIEAVARRAMARSSETDLAVYVARTAAGSLSLSDVLDEITIRETYFFREPEQFAELRETILPEIVQRRGEGVVRCWSAGCASGEETYSLAIVLHEMGLGERARLVGTDVSLAALAEARAGSYRTWSLRGTSALHAAAYLERAPAAHPLEERVQLVSSIRRRASFSQLNLLDDACPPPELGLGGCDLVLCRNVLVYFDARSLAHVVKKLYDSLDEGGWLIAASSDPPLGSLAPFFCVPTPRGVFYRKLARRPIAPRCEPSLLASNADADAIAPTERAQPIVVSPRTLPPPAVVAVAPPATIPAPTPPSRAHPVDAKGAYEQSVWLVDQRRDEEAIVALRRAIYLDPSFVTAHLALGLALVRTGNDEAAARSLRTAHRLASALPPGTIVPYTGGTNAAGVAVLAATQRRRLDRAKTPQ